MDSLIKQTGEHIANVSKALKEQDARLKVTLKENGVCDPIEVTVEGYKGFQSGTVHLTATNDGHHVWNFEPSASLRDALERAGICFKENEE